MPNYGDVALNLPKDWSRQNLASGHEFMLIAIGHENGVADLYVTERPNDEHQFQWCDPKDLDRLHHLRARKYEFCKADKWTKNELLWSWDAENFVEFKGQRAMARPASYYYEEKKAKERAESERRMRGDRDEADEYAAKKLGEKAYDDKGRELRPMKQARG